MEKKLDSNDYALIKVVMSSMRVAKDWKSSDYNKAQLVIFDINQHYDKPKSTENGKISFFNKIKLLIKIWQSL